MSIGWFSRSVEFCEDWAYMAKHVGWFPALWEAMREFARLPYRHEHFNILARTLREPLPDLRPKIPLEVRSFGLADLPLVRKMYRPSEAKLCARRLQLGQIGLLALHEGQPAGYAWASDRMDPTVERVQFELDPGDGICLDVFTAPAMRGKGVQTTLALARSRALRDRGFSRVVTYIAKTNHASLAVWQRKLGSQVIGEIDFVRIGPWRRIRYYWSCKED